MTRLSCIAGALLVVASTTPGWAGQGEPTILLQETFDDNGAGWKEQQTTWIRSGVEDGVFRITTQVNLQQTVVRNVQLPATADFDVECTVETRRGNHEWPVGLVWGYRNPANFLEFVIWMDGRFRITRNASLDTQLLVPETKTADLHTGFATNALKISRRGERLQFFVNGAWQGEIPLTGPIGPSVGFVVWNEIEVLFDDLVVTALE